MNNLSTFLDTTMLLAAIAVLAYGLTLLLTPESKDIKYDVSRKDTQFIEDHRDLDDVC